MLKRNAAHRATFLTMRRLLVAAVVVLAVCRSPVQAATTVAKVGELKLLAREKDGRLCVTLFRNARNYDRQARLPHSGDGRGFWTRLASGAARRPRRSMPYADDLRAAGHPGHPIASKGGGGPPVAPSLTQVSQPPATTRWDGPA